MKKKILIVGVGNIGYRHFQSVNALKKIEITLIDPKIQKIKKLYLTNEIKKNNHYIFYNTISRVFNKKFDLVIIATNSKIRLKIFDNLVKKNVSKNIILEKVVYSNLNEYNKYLNIINTRKINCWVNCLNRVFPVSKNIKSTSKKYKLKKLQLLVRIGAFFVILFIFLILLPT